MASGTVKWFDARKGYGFIEQDEGGQDAFVHITAVERAGLSGLAEGDRVDYELTSRPDGRSAAESLSLQT